MNFPRCTLLVSCAALSLSIPAFAGVTVNAPGNNTDVSSPFTLSASSSNCSSQSVSAMGYSFDSSSDTTVVNKQSIDTSLDVSAGTHTLHVKAWGDHGASCVTDVTIIVKSGGSGGSGGGSEIPSYAKSVSHIQALSGWQNSHDSGGNGSSSGYSGVVSSPSLYGSTRRFVTSFSNNGDERY